MEASMRISSALLVTATFGIALTAHVAAAQGTARFYTPGGAVAPGAQPASRYERISGRNNPALTHFGGSKAVAYASQNRTQLPAPLPVLTAPMAKPFSGVQQAGGVSPYLALDARESPTSLPNYYLYVQPQLQQQQMNQVQQAQYRRVQQQRRKAAAGGAVSTPNGGIPTTGHSAQFLHNGGYYPGLK
jgi:hypothetical protein